MSDIQARKQAHIDLCLLPESQGAGDLFAGYDLPYRALPELNMEHVSPATELFGKKLSQPLIIASMTGGMAHAKTINANLALAAEACKVAMGVGSQRIALEKEEAKETFTLVRQLAPTAVLFANMGVAQLNKGFEVDDYQRVVDMLKADALYLHINPLQEALQPEGDFDFSGLLDKIAELVTKINVPVFVKEVGHGIDLATAQALVERGVAGVDCAGVGGTSYAWVEAKRAGNTAFMEWFKSVGYRSDDLIREYKALPSSIKKVISGGVRTPLEVIKAGAFGADYYSIAQPFLVPAMESSEAVMAMIEQWRKALQIGLYVTGCPTWSDVRSLKLRSKA